LFEAGVETALFPSELSLFCCPWASTFGIFVIYCLMRVRDACQKVGCGLALRGIIAKMLKILSGLIARPVIYTSSLVNEQHAVE
jgi:hypothetical protein